MKIAILSRPGDCFPNIISIGLSNMLTQLKKEHKIFYDAIPFLMRLLPLTEKPRHWSNSFQFRIRNKIKYYNHDKKFLKELKEYDIFILSECVPNAFWKNYLAIETFKKAVKNKPVLCYLDAYLENAPRHKKMLLDDKDAGISRYNFNLCPSPVTEITNADRSNWSAIGIDLTKSDLSPVKKKEFIAVLDFSQPGYEVQRQQQQKALQKLNIKTIALEGRYKIEEIRKIYREASVFFLSFPETFGLPIAECLACGTKIFTPESGWPMSWRLNKNPESWANGELPDCFTVYDNEDDLVNQLQKMRDSYDLEKSPQLVFNTFINHYSTFYYGDVNALQVVLDKFEKN
ncbi:MAG TPA: hypothetical protein VIH86_07185 [Puia sp.]